MACDLIFHIIILRVIENPVTCMLVGWTFCGELPCNGAVEDNENNQGQPEEEADSKCRR